MTETITISDNFEVNLSEVSQISNIIEIDKNTSMFSFTLGLKNGSFKNVCLHYDAHNRSLIKQKAGKLHRKIKSFLIGKEITNSIMC